VVVSTTLTFDLGITPEKLTLIEFVQGDLNIFAGSTFASPNLSFKSELTLPGFTKDLAPLQSIATGSPSSQDLSLDGYTAVMNDNLFTATVLLTIKSLGPAVTIPPGTRFSFTLKFENIDFEYLEGFFGDQTTDLPDETLKIGAFENSFDKGEVSLTDPRISFQVVNEYGMPMNVIFNELEARNSTGSLDITLDPSTSIPANFPTQRGDSAFTIVDVTNAKALLDFEPTEFYYNISARINQNLTSGFNFCENDSELKVRMKVEIPFIGHASDIVISDTVDIDISDVDASDIESATIRINASNRLPLDATLQLYLLNENDILLDSLLAPNTIVVEGAETDNEGNPIAATDFKNDIEIDQQKINTLFEAKKIIIASRLNTIGADSEKNVKFKSLDKLIVTLGLNLKLKLNLDL